MTDMSFLSVCIEISLFMVMAGVVLSFVRLVKGPTNADRIVAIDMMTVSIVAFCGLFAVRSGTAAFLDVAVVLALVGFLSTLALARFAERQLKRRAEGGVRSPAQILDDEARNTPDTTQETRP